MVHNKHNHAKNNKRTGQTSTNTTAVPLARDTTITRHSDNSGWQKDKERIAEVIVDEAGSFVLSVIQRIQPGLESFAPWLAETFGQGWVKWIARALSFRFVSDVPSTTAGNLVFGWLPDATARLPTSMVEATQAAVYVSGNFNSNHTLRIPAKCLRDAFEDMKFTRQGSVDGDLNLYDLGVFFVATEGFQAASLPTTPQCVGFVDMELDSMFAEKQVPRQIVTVGDGFNSEYTDVLMIGTGVPGASPVLGINNNNPAGVMLYRNTLAQNDELYLPPGTFIVHIGFKVASLAVDRTFVQIRRRDLTNDQIATAGDSTIGNTTSVDLGTWFNANIPGTGDDMNNEIRGTFIITNTGNAVPVNVITDPLMMYSTNLRLKIFPEATTSIPSFVTNDDIGHIYVRRLSAEGPVGLYGVGQETSSVSTSIARYLDMMSLRGERVDLASALTRARKLTSIEPIEPTPQQQAPQLQEKSKSTDTTSGEPKTKQQPETSTVDTSTNPLQPYSLSIQEYQGTAKRIECKLHRWTRSLPIEDYGRYLHARIPQGDNIMRRKFLLRFMLHLDEVGDPEGLLPDVRTLLDQHPYFILDDEGQLHDTEV
jgi:hypothetical protein